METIPQKTMDTLSAYAEELTVDLMFADNKGRTYKELTSILDVVRPNYPEPFTKLGLSLTKEWEGIRASRLRSLMDFHRHFFILAVGKGYEKALEQNDLTEIPLFEGTNEALDNLIIKGEDS